MLFLDVFCWSLFLQMLKRGVLWYTEILTVAVVGFTFYTQGDKHLPPLLKESWLVAPGND